MGALSEFIFQSKYSRYIPSLERKETWEESVDRISAMHLQHLSEKYPKALESAEFNSLFLETFQAYKEKKLVGSQRNLQFGGDPVLKHHVKSYNCSFCYADKLRVFSDIEYILLCGAGAGISVERQHVNKLPMMLEHLDKGTENFVIEDSIEGWMYAVQQLVNYFFVPNTKYPIFDYSSIRPEGSLIAGLFIAPGPEGLKHSLQKIEEILRSAYKSTRKLTPLQVTDIIAHEADSVLSGGVRRSACIILFDPDDEEMFNCKTGNWFYSQPQRARFNMSAVLERGITTRDVYHKVMKATKEFGEPGFFWRSDCGVGCNPLITLAA